jgi:hypothetical protein
MELFNGRNIDGFTADNREPIQSVQADSAQSAAELIRGLKLTSNDFLAAPCVEVWPIDDPYSRTRFYRRR